MASIALEFLFVGAITLTLLVSMVLLFFIQVFDRILQERVYPTSLRAFQIFLASIIFHVLYLVSSRVLHQEPFDALFEIAGLATFFYGMYLLTKVALETHLSFETNKRLKEELDVKTTALKLYAADLKNSNNLKDLFTDIMTHDLLNPVGVIMNFADLMSSEEEEFTTDNLRIIKRNAYKCVEMINGARVLSKMEDIKEGGFEQMDIGEIINGEIKEIAERASEKGIKIVENLEGSYPIKAGAYIKHIFSNLLSNAVKYSPPNSEVTVSVKEEEGHWKVAVSDKGEGVKDDYKEAIFERFERKGKKGVRGSGLGLAIVKRITELHSGRAWVEDNPDGGSTFIVRIPKGL